MNLFVQTPSNGTITLDVEPSDSIENIKGKIFDAISMPTQNQILKFNGVTLLDNSTLADNNIVNNNSTIILTDATLNNIHQAVLSGGGNATGSNGSLSYSIGQVFYQTSTSANNSVAAGVQQAGAASSVLCSTGLPTGGGISQNGAFVTSQTFQTSCAGKLGTIVFTPTGSSVDDLRGQNVFIGVRLKSSTGTLLGNATIGGASTTDQWFNGATITADFSAANISLAANTTYSWEVYESTNTLELFLFYRSTNNAYLLGNAFRDGISIGSDRDYLGWEVNIQTSACSAPTITASTPNNRCGAGSVTLSATPSAGSIQWFTAETGGTALVSGTDYTISGNNLTINNLTATTTFYAQAVDGSCVSAARTAVMATFNALPSAPIANSTQTFCVSNGVPTVANLSATGSGIKWYLLSTGGSALATSQTLGTNTYYTSQTVNGCESNRTMVSVLVSNDPPFGLTASATTVCAGSGVTLTATPQISLNVGSTGSYLLNPATFGVPLNSSLSGALVNAPTNGCSAFTAGLFTGKIALIERGICGFTTKALNAQNAGAIAVIIYNNVAGTLSIGGTDASITIPVYSMSKDDALLVINAMVNSEVSVNIGGYPASYLWSTGETTQVINPTNLSQNTTYSVTLTNGTTGCQKTNSISITVNTTPAPTANATQVFCNSATISNLVATGTALKWYDVATGGTALTTTTAIASGTYHVSQTLNSCESARTLVNVVVGSLPMPTPSSDSPKCIGTTLTFNSVAGMSTYTWSGPNSFTASTQNPSIANVSAAAQGTYTLTVTNANGCSASATTAVTINALPMPNPSSDSPKCIGTTLTLNAVPNVGLNSVAPTNIYAWAGPNSFTASTQNPSISNVSAAAQGTYTLTVTNVNGCSASATTAVTINALPMPNPSSDSPKCIGTTLTFNSAAGMSAYAWSGPNSFTASTRNPSIENIMAAAQGTYTLTVTNINGCTASATTAVTINALPMPNPSSDSPKCIGTTLTLNAVPNVGLNSVAPTNTYAWAGPNSFTASTQNPIITNVSAAAQGTYTLTVTNVNGCSASATTAVTINALPMPNPSSDSPKCVGTTLTFNAVPNVGLNGLTPTNTYAWTGPNAFTANTANPSIENVTAAAQGTYTLTVTNANGCSASATTAVTINALPMPNPSSDSPKCIGTTLTFNSVAGMSTYAWAGPNSFTASTQNPTITNVSAAAQGTYTLTVTNANGCSASATTAVIINTLPNAIISSNSPVCAGTTINLTAENGGTNYSWTGPNEFNSTLQNPTIPNSIVANSGIYKLTTTNSSGCTATATLTVLVNPLSVNTTNTGPYLTNQTVQLVASGGNTYSWTGPNGFTATGAIVNRSNATLNMAGIYTATITNGPCSNTATTNVIVTGIDPCVQLLEYTYYKAGNPGTAMFSLQNGMNIAQENFPTSIIVRPTCSTLRIESVEMNLQGPAGFNWNILQSIEPFALFDNFGLNTFGRTLAPGTYTLAVTGYSQDNKGGTVTYPTVNTTFTIVGTSAIINMPTYTGTAFCAGNTVSVNFTTSGVFNANNQFNIQLSDANGDFTNAISIGTSTTAGSINCTIPQSMPYGENYRMRVLSSNVVAQNMNPSAITIHPYIANLATPTDDYSTDKNRSAVYQVNATNKINSPAKVNYQAGNSISLNPGFEAKAGSVFKAEIKACQN